MKTWDILWARNKQHQTFTETIIRDKTTEGSAERGKCKILTAKPLQDVVMTRALLTQKFYRGHRLAKALFSLNERMDASVMEFHRQSNCN